MPAVKGSLLDAGSCSLLIISSCLGRACVDIPQGAESLLPLKQEACQARSSSKSPANGQDPAPLRHSHGRSTSNPFPLLFGTMKRAVKTAEPIPHSRNEQASTPDVSARSVSPRRSPGRQDKRPPQRSADFQTGFCATCGANVRWPKQLTVYRCTACLMVNDLTADRLDHAKSTILPGASVASSGSPARPLRRKVPPLSLERTRALVHEGIAAYLQVRCRGFECEKDLPTPDATQPHVSLVTRRRSDTPRLSTPLRSIRGSAPTIDEAGQEPCSVRATSDETKLSASQPAPNRALASTAVQSSPSPNSTSPTGSHIFHLLETYLLSCLADCDCLNESFHPQRPMPAPRAASDNSLGSPSVHRDGAAARTFEFLSEIDAKTLLLGDIVENGTWWAGSPSDQSNGPDLGTSAQEQRVQRIDWSAVDRWYHTLLVCGRQWREELAMLSPEDRARLFRQTTIEKLEQDFASGRQHLHRILLKGIETLLHRPGRPLESLEHSRFLAILLVNPFLTISANAGVHSQTSHSATRPKSSEPLAGSRQKAPENSDSFSLSRHPGITKRILGLLARLPTESQNFVRSCLSRLSAVQFRNIVELVDSFITYRLARQHRRGVSDTTDPIDQLIPDMSGPGAGTPAHLHAVLGATHANGTQREKAIPYRENWQITAAAQVMALLFVANLQARAPRLDPTNGSSTSQRSRHSATLQGLAVRSKHAPLVPTSAFYNNYLDCMDLVADFETWELRRGKFAFCQYPMILSIGAKIRILEHEARRQMEVKARDAFFTSILSRRAVNQYLVLKVRRNCLVDDSLREVSEVVGTGQEEVKKGLKIDFVGEEGVDAGGLRKEWFLLLIREVFDPEHGLFLYDADSNYCYFNGNSLETSDQFFLVGVVMGLAIYNSTILDVALPPFAFRKLLAAAPAYVGPVTTAVRPTPGYTLEDLAEWRPALAQGLQKLLDFDGDVEATFCRYFAIDVERYGQTVSVPLCRQGETRPVTRDNRKEFVELYVQYLLDTSVARQFEPFKRGFYTVCAGNALALFRPEEIELLVRGADDVLDTTSLRAVALYENWDNITSTPQEAPLIQWFWEAFAAAPVRQQRKLLTFITGSDRIPAMGAASLPIKIVYLGADARRLPLARTCFNILGLYNYATRAELETKLWQAVFGSEGFGLR